MYRTFIATVTAASIALTAIGAVPVAAGERERANAIAAILGLAVVGAIVHNKNKKDDVKVHQRHPKPVHKQPTYKKPTYKKPQHADVPRYQPKPRPLPQRANRKVLPKQCFQSFETHRGKVRMFGARCLKRNFKFAHRLPSQCQYIFNTSRGDRRGYEARCLRDQGYRLARG